MIVGRIRRSNHLLCLRLFAREIKVYQHLLCLFLAPLPASQLFHQLLRIRAFVLICLPCSGSSRRKKELNAKRHADLLALLTAL